jgi:hypothetical protein
MPSGASDAKIACHDFHHGGCRALCVAGDGSRCRPWRRSRQALVRRLPPRGGRAEAGKRRRSILRLNRAEIELHAGKGRLLPVGPAPKDAKLPAEQERGGRSGSLYRLAPPIAPKSKCKSLPVFSRQGSAERMTNGGFLTRWPIMDLLPNSSLWHAPAQDFFVGSAP